MNEKIDYKNILAKYLEGRFTKDEALQMFSYIKENTQDQVLHEEMEKAWAKLSNERTLSNTEKRTLEQEARSILREGNINILRRKTIISIAASIFILLSVGFGSYIYVINQHIQEAKILTIATHSSETKEIILPDNTKVILNSCTKISYPEVFVDNERKIELEGEAFFEVSKNPQKPFIITTDKFSIQVLGTEFNVKAYDNDLIQSVNVQGGKVRVNLEESSLDLIAEEKMDLFIETNEYVKAQSQDKIGVWREQSMLFNRTPIKDVANELERMYNVNITFAKEQVFNNLISGEHTNTNLVSVLESLKLTSGIHYKYDTKTNEVYLYK